MTDKTKHEPLYQVWAIKTETGDMVPVPMFPKSMKESAEHFAYTMQQMIIAGKEKRYSDPMPVICLA